MQKGTKIRKRSKKKLRGEFFKLGANLSKLGVRLILCRNNSDSNKTLVKMSAIDGEGFVAVKDSFPFKNLFLSAALTFVAIAMQEKRH